MSTARSVSSSHATVAALSHLCNGRRVVVSVVVVGVVMRMGYRMIEREQSFVIDHSVPDYTATTAIEK